MDKIVYLAELDEEDSLLLQAMQIINEAIDQASA
ncbi:hypothetical protein F975_01502 [Acinetobacter sp. ANC 3789]|nr:hypothetical protein F975_01502 [Acinetobacter sp. ANC 3789]